MLWGLIALLILLWLLGVVLKVTASIALHLLLLVALVLFMIKIFSGRRT